jgi:hypothetical protein
MNSKTKAINLFTKHTKYGINQIIDIKLIHNGFTNISYKVTTSDKRIYQIRVGNNKVVQRINERNVLNLINDKVYLYFDIKSGDAIKK